MRPPSPRRLPLDPADGSARAARRALFLPPLLAALCWAGGRLTPDGTVWGAALSALLIASPRWCMALWALTGPLLAARVAALRAPGLLLGALGLALCGWPSGPAAEPPDPAGLVIVSSNVNSYSPDPDPARLEAALGALQPDLLLVIERRAEQIPGMTRIADDFEDDLPRPSHALAVFAREGLPVEARVTPEFGSETAKMPLALIRLESGLCLLGMHAPPPAPYDPSGIGPYTRTLAAHLAAGRLSQDWAPCRAGDGALIVGDMNAVPGSRAWRTLTEGTGLADALRSWGLWALTWPAGGGWLNFPYFQLDHLLVGQARVSGLEVLRVEGTDHKALRFRLTAPEPGPARGGHEKKRDLKTLN